MAGWIEKAGQPDSPVFLFVMPKPMSGTWETWRTGARLDWIGILDRSGIEIVNSPKYVPPSAATAAESPIPGSEMPPPIPGTVGAQEGADTAAIVGTVADTVATLFARLDVDDEWLRVRNLSVDVTKLKSALEREVSRGSA